MASLSVIIITKNAAESILICLESVRFANEIIVLDSGSTDGTLALCQKYTDKVYEVDWPGYGVQKNRALAKANHEWVLSIDADEQIIPELRREIETIITDNSATFDAYTIRRLSKYCGKFIRYGDWRNDCPIRLFRRDKGHFKEVPVHEDLIVTGKVGKIRAHMLHNPYRNLEGVLFKLNNYSSLSAKLKQEQGKSANLSIAVLRGLWTFFRCYFLKLGFLDGREGFMLAFYNAEGCYYRYLKLMYLNQQDFPPP
jgi:glycosyltransferase involved in cell wall biosynthesis